MHSKLIISTTNKVLRLQQHTKRRPFAKKRREESKRKSMYDKIYSYICLNGSHLI